MSFVTVLYDIFMRVQLIKEIQNILTVFCRVLLVSNIDPLIPSPPFIVGMMFHNCVNGTVYSGANEGFQSIVVDEAANTLDQKLHGERLLKQKVVKKAFFADIQFFYAKVKKIQDILDNNY